MAARAVLEGAGDALVTDYVELADFESGRSVRDDGFAGTATLAVAARVGTLAAEVGWSRRYLSARFREAIGLPPKALGRVIRVEHAAGRMRAGDPLGDVAYDAGYADQAHFNRDFREIVGCTPTEFPNVQDMAVAV